MVYWLRQTAHDQEVVSLNPSTVYWMDVSDASYYIQIMKIKKIKVAKWGTPKKPLYDNLTIQKELSQWMFD